MTYCRRPSLLRIALAAVVLAGALFALASIHSSRARGANLDQLNSELGAQRARQQSLSASVGHLSSLIASLDSQIALVRSREAAVRAELARDRVRLANTTAALARERRRLAILKARLAHARMLLARQLLSSYENDKPDLVGVVLNARGFTDLLEQISFLQRAESAQQFIISLTRSAKARAAAATQRLTVLEAQDRQATNAAAVQARALAGMNALLDAKQSALAGARAAQQMALSASRARSRTLEGQIATIRAQQAAAARAAAAAAARAAAAAAAAASAPRASASSASSSSGASASSGSSASSSSPPVASGPALGASGGWAIPYPIVLCESGGQDLPPNSAGASGYYQIMPATWKGEGGSGPAAYLASKAEQDAVASRLWNGGAGASNWVCAGIVGIH
jgi:peptidoglycan hydrolase CwlO-like protein